MAQIYLQPYEIFPDPFNKNEGVKSGTVIRKNEPRFTCRFEFCSEIPEDTGKGLTIYNVNTGVFLSDLELHISKKRFSIKDISLSMRDAARFIDRTLKEKN